MTASVALTEQAVLDAADELVAAFARTDTGAYFAAFSPEATFVFHPEAARLESRAEYEALWAGWLADGWRVVRCDSTDRRVQLLGDAAVFSHTVATVISVDGAEEALRERETIVFHRGADGRILAVHEHLSPAPVA